MDSPDRCGGAPVQAPAAKSVLADWTRALTATADIARRPDRTLPDIIEQIASDAPDAPALLADGERFTYGELNARVNRYARWARRTGFQPGDVVALLMENRPEYIAAWLGLSKAGVVVALLNTNLRAAALAHCVRTARAEAVIVSAMFADVWDGAASCLDPAPDVHLHGGDRPGVHRIDTALEHLSGNEIPPDRRPVTILDRALLIYTSGTTGLPKAANVSHGRVLSWSLWFAGMLDTGPSDRMYDCLPLYHSVGGVVAAGALLARGGSVVVATGFSASRFWDDIARWDCTLAQYIGELCRYLLATPVRALDASHGLRALCGNGLRKDVWEKFQMRFAVPRIVEFYAASEGTFSLYNMEGEPGAIGRVPGFLGHRFPAALVRYDETTGLPWRNEDGRCVRTPRGERGEAIGRISLRGDDAPSFEGYTDRAATDAKILRDVFAEGDAWVRTGDLMRIDDRGFWYFVDRIGDTFRWKGENVATADVAAVLSSCEGVRDAVVYGVEVPGADGRAGMAALSVSQSFDLGALAACVTDRLPAYARPVFVRLANELAVTGTFKHQTKHLQDQGFDPRSVPDRLFLFDMDRQAYVPLDGARFQAVRDGSLRL